MLIGPGRVLHGAVVAGVAAGEECGGGVEATEGGDVVAVHGFGLSGGSVSGEGEGGAYGRF